ncbi:unnamed protein product [Linum tenue]|uniref:Uncharacterized protein n=1 Tax=Linum tenue TaxID=586396 RepID=A0AAV0PI44_9ROSI|nr:unnamed protein product [Linum tenue]
MILTTIPTIEFILFIHRHRPPPLTTIASIDIIRRGSSPPLQGDQLPLTPVIVISLFLPPGQELHFSLKTPCFSSIAQGILSTS